MLNMSVANACIRGSLFDLDENHPIPGNADAVHTLQLHQLPPQTQDALKQLIAVEDAVALIRGQCLLLLAWRRGWRLC